MPVLQWFHGSVISSSSYNNLYV
ncbi:unnamed protein product [Acanthoscelides obtectus]|uniref:Uncharacterized protein n=1 Tax=Acanthoscelides obtectus TaxID=200917 RepID=A0A9P0PRZ2_ACAOB|nr:unnamed protein product [Acanthoscelides obtectus]CAK1640290.1 hypothetical protein AOBTE_LOCUS11641 [Acanthoscelides obtectus]